MCGVGDTRERWPDLCHILKGATSWPWSHTFSLSSTRAATSPSTAWRTRSSRRCEPISCSRRLHIQVLLGLLGWQRQLSGGGGRLRGGETSNMHRDLTITTFAPWEPGASTPVPMASSNREESKAEAETGFISHVSCAISTIPPTSSPDQIN